MANQLTIKIALLIDEAKAKAKEMQDSLRNLGQGGNNNAKMQLDEVGKSAGVAGGAINRMSSVVKSMIASAFAVGALVAFTNKLVETVRVIQDLRMRLSGLTQSAEDYASSEVYLTDLAHKHHKSVQELTAGYSSFLALEQSGIITRQQSIQLLEGFSNAASKTGASQTQMGQSTYGLAQALGTGIVAMEEFKQITEPMPGLANSLANAYGMTVGELRKLIGTGTVASEEFGKKFVVALQDYEGAAERAGGTISASYADAGNAYTEMAKDLEKPVAGLAIGVTDAGKSAYGWLKDNGDTVITLLTGIAVVTAGKGLSALAAYNAAGAQAFHIENDHTAAIIENETRTVSARTAKVAAAEAKLLERTATAELAQAELALTAATLEVARANELASGSAAMLVDAEIAQTAAATRLTNATRSQAAADAFLISQNAKLAESQLALTAATNASGAAMTRIAAAGKAAFSFIGGWVGVAVLALWGLYEILEKVSDSEGRAERTSKNLSDALSLMNAEVKKLTIAEVDIDFSKTEKSIASLKQQIKDLEASTHFGNINENIDKRAVLQQRVAVEEKHLDANKAQKNDLITNFDASGLTSDELPIKLKETENEIGKIRYHIEELKRSTGDATVIDGLINESKLALNAYNSQLSAIKGAQDTLSKTGKTDPKIAEANAKAEEKSIASGFKLREQQAKNAYDVARAYAEKDTVKKLQIEKDYNDQSLALTLERLNAEIAAKTKVSELSGKKTKAPELQAELADLENQKLAAIDNAKTKGVTLDIDAQNHAADIHKAELSAQSDIELGRIELTAEKAQAESKQAQDELKQLKSHGSLGGSQQDMMQGVFSAFKNAGFSPNQAKALTAEVGRENDYNPKAVFGNHTDAANGKTNTGFFSWQGDRSTALKASLAEQGLLQNGKISHSQESLNAMAAFAKTEMQSGQYKGSTQFLANKNIGSEAAANQLGHGYIKWAMGQDTLKNGDSFDWKKHDAKRAGYYNQIDSTSKNDGGDEKQLIEQGIAGTQHYYEELTNAQNKGIEASIAAVKAKLALAEKDYATKKATAMPEELPKLEADYTTNKAKLTQELSQLQAELLAIKKAGDAEMAAEIAKAKQEEIAIEESAALGLVQVAETEAQQQLELGQLSNTKFLEKQRAFEAQRYQIALKAAQDRRGLLDDGDATGKAKALGQEKALGVKHAADMKAINHKMALDSQATFNGIVAPIKSAFSSTIKGILQGTTTLKQGLKNMAQSIVLSFAGSLADMAIDAAAHWAWELLGFGTKEAAKTGMKVAGEAAQTGATIVGTQTRVAAEATASAESSAIEFGSGMKKIANKAATAAAGAFDAMVGIPYVGPIIAPIAAATAFIGVMAFGGLMSSAGGEWDVPNDRLNLVHKNETILPANIAAPMREFFTKDGATKNPPAGTAYSSQTVVNKNQDKDSGNLNEINISSKKTSENTDKNTASLNSIEKKDEEKSGSKFKSILTGGWMSSAGGEWDVPNDRLNLVHKNETILPATIAAPMREFFTNGGIGNVGLPAQLLSNNSMSNGLANTAASSLAIQQSLIQNQQKQAKQASGGTVVLNTKGGNFVHKDDVIALLKKENRNFRMS